MEDLSGYGRAIGELDGERLVLVNCSATCRSVEDLVTLAVFCAVRPREEEVTGTRVKVD